MSRSFSNQDEHRAQLRRIPANSFAQQVDSSDEKLANLYDACLPHFPWIAQSSTERLESFFAAIDGYNPTAYGVVKRAGGLTIKIPDGRTFLDTEVKANTKYFYKLEDVSTSGETELHGPVTVATTKEEIIPAKFSLGTAYPNPFNPTTTINFSLAEEAKIQINIYDMKGNLMNQLTNTDYSVGNYNVVWNATDFNSNPVSAGIYICQMITNTGFKQSAKMILIK